MIQYSLSLPPELRTDAFDEWLIGEGAWFSERLEGAVNLRVTGPDGWVLPEKCAPWLVEEKSIADSEWQREWWRQHEGFPLTDSIYVAFPGTEIPDQFEHILRVNPGAAFGDGHHDTTRLAASLLREVTIDSVSPLRLCDCGTGTGILSLAASLYWPLRVTLVDHDPEALRTALENCEKGDIDVESFHVVDLKTSVPEGPYDTVVSNVITDVNLALLPALPSMLAEEGWAVITGIGEQWQDEFREALAKLPLCIINEKRQNGWCAWLVRKKGD